MNISGIINFIDSRISIGFDVPPIQAINYFKNKGLKTSFSYADMLAADHVNNFTIAKMMDMDLLQDMYDSLLHAQKNGLTMQQWKDRIIPHLQANGWWGRQQLVDPVTGKTIITELGSSRRLDLIFRQNMQSAYAAGQWQQIKEQERIAPYLMYNAVDDYRTREEHRALDNKIYPVSHYFWYIYYPPNGFNCRCGVIQFSKSDLDSFGYEVSPDPDIEYKDWKNPRTGLIEKIPKGTDAGFNFNAGQARYEQLQRLAKEKAKAIKDSELRDAAENALMLIEKQDKTLGKRDIVNAQAVVIEPDMKPVRTEWGGFPDVIVNAPLKEAAIHPAYPLAKGGDKDASLELASDLLKKESIDKVIKLAGDTNPILVSVHAEESVSVNFIPLAMSIVVSEKTGFQFDTSIIQSKKVGRTSAPDGFYRIAVTPTFAGEFPSGRTAIILDDTLTQGGTFASLKGHIESQGGTVIGAIALTGKQYSAKIAISVETLSSLREKYGQLEEWFNEYIGYGFDKLTESEARYILGSKQDAITVKNRIIAAREERRS